MLTMSAILILAAVTPAVTPAVTFKDIAATAGITFVHDMGKSGQKMMVETMGSGGGFIDYDNDGDLDLYLINGAPLPGNTSHATPSDAMYRNDSAGGKVIYTDVTAETHTGDTSYGMGFCAGDYDNDGFTDFYVTNFGPDVLYHNDGNGTFSNATAAGGPTDPHWSSSCAFLDYDSDGDLDLYVVNYVDHTPTNNKFCGDYGAGVRSYCHPNVYNSEPSMLYRNEGDGTFKDVSDAAGLTARRGNGLGIVTGDIDNDGDIDIYIANDKTPNVLYRNNGNGTFTDITLTAGVGFSLDGVPQAGMGTDMGDYDGDGDLDLIVTNLDFEYNALYRNEGGEIFSDMSFPAGIGAVSLSYVGFGAKFLDYDNDGRLDLVIANGHILDNAPYFNDATTYAQRNFLFHGEAGGTFKEVGETSGQDLKIVNVARGLFTGDVDGDGDLDMMVTVNGGAPRLFLNSLNPVNSLNFVNSVNNDGNANSWLGVRLVGKSSNRSALGARVKVIGPVGPMIDEVRSGTSYLSQSDLRLHFGLGQSQTPPAIEVRWPNGKVESVKAPGINRVIAILEGSGVVEQ